MPSDQDSSSFDHQIEIKNILILDDDRDLSDALKLLLEARNFVVTSVENGVDGIREVLDMDFDVIICDLLMPHMRGDHFYLAVKKLKPSQADRFIFITGHSDKPELNDFLKSVDGLSLHKPFGHDDLIHTISLAMKRGEGAAV